MNVSENERTEQGAWPGAIAAITLFVEDLEAAKRFYREVFELPVVFEDDNSTVFKFGETLDQPAEDERGTRGSSSRRPWRPWTRACGSSSRSAWTTSTRCARN